MKEIQVKIKKTTRENGQAVNEPIYATAGSAGMDLCAYLEADLTIDPGAIVRVPTGIALQLPDSSIGGFVFPRSGLSSKHGVSLANCVGVIDSDYTGEVVCPVINHSDKAYTVKNGDRIAQIVFMPIYRANLIWVDELEDTERGAGGFGSTGI